jgi:hypothetical protein
MPATSTKQANTAKLAGAVKAGKFPASKAGSSVKSMAQMPMDKLKHFMKMKEQMTDEPKRRLLVGLRKLKEQTGNIGGTTDIPADGNLTVAENEFTSGDHQPSAKVIAKTFDTEADYDSYVNQRRGIEMTPKELQTVSVMAEATIPQQAQQPMPMQNPAAPKAPTRPQSPTPQPQQKPQPEEQPDDTTADDHIRVQKSNTFVDDTQGADILANFLSELELHQEKPTAGDKFFLRYELTDDFGNNTTTVIKKLKEGNQFCWTAFSKYESAEEEGNPGSKEEK